MEAEDVVPGGGGERSETEARDAEVGDRGFPYESEKNECQRGRNIRQPTECSLGWSALKKLRPVALYKYNVAPIGKSLA